MPQQPKVRIARRVWRISKEAPLGEWVDLGASVAAPAQASNDPPEVSFETWVTSSFDLVRGVDVIEDPDTIPGELLDELFAPPSSPRKRPKG